MGTDNSCLCAPDFSNASDNIVPFSNNKPMCIEISDTPFLNRSD